MTTTTTTTQSIPVTLQEKKDFVKRFVDLYGGDKESLQLECECYKLILYEKHFSEAFDYLVKSGVHEFTIYMEGVGIDDFQYQSNLSPIIQLDSTYTITFSTCYGNGWLDTQFVGMCECKLILFGITLVKYY